MNSFPEKKKKKKEREEKGGQRREKRHESFRGFREERRAIGKLEELPVIKKKRKKKSRMFIREQVKKGY